MTVSDSDGIRETRQIVTIQNPRKLKYKNVIQIIRIIEF